MDLGDFVPIYPDPTEWETYNAKLSAKREYSILSTPKRASSIFFNHQVVGIRHLAPHTPTKKCYFHWDTGVGKTCVGGGVGEMYHWVIGQVTRGLTADERLNTHKVLIVAQNKTGVNTFRDDIMRTCTAGSYVTEKQKMTIYKTPGRKQASETVSIQRTYELQRHKKLANKLKEMTDEAIAQMYSFRVILIDEIHMAKATISKAGPSKEMETTKMIFNQLYRLVTLAVGGVIVVLGATPIVNDIYEFPSTINFITDEETFIDPATFARIIDRNKMNNRYLGETYNFERLRRELKAYLYPRLVGRISRVKKNASKSKTVIISNGDKELLGPLASDLWVTNISTGDQDGINYDDILDAYHRALAQDEDRQGGKQFSQVSRAVSNISWPEKLLGSDAHGKFLRLTDGKVYRFTEEFLEDFRFHTNEARKTIRANLEKRLKDQMGKEDRDEEIEDILKEYIEDYTDAIEERGENSYDPTDEIDMASMMWAIKARYSPKIASTLSAIMGVMYTDKTGKVKFDVTPDSDNLEAAYVYNFYKFDGVIPMSLFMREFGYQQLVVDSNSRYTGAKGNLVLKPAKRYAVIYRSEEVKMSEGAIKEILKIMNHPSNRYGHYLKALFGTDISAQGVNILQARQNHITSPHWNLAGKIQASGRTDRETSHRDFGDISNIPKDKAIHVLPNGREVRVGVYSINGRQDTQRYVKQFNHAVIFEETREHEEELDLLDSIDLKMHFDAFKKERVNKIPIEIMEQIAFDSAINRYRNLAPDEELDVVGFSKKFEPDYTTYNMYYADKEIERIKCLVRGIFSSAFSVRLEDIISSMPMHHFSTVVKALTQMVNNRDRIINRHGDVNYIVEHNDLFYLQHEYPDYSKPTDAIMTYYSKYSYIKSKSKIGDISSQLSVKVAKDAIDKIRDMEVFDIHTVRGIIRPLKNRTKKSLVEYLSVRSDIIPPQRFDAIFDTLKMSVIWFPANELLVHIYALRIRQESQSGGQENVLKIPETAKGELRILAKSEGVWRNTRSEEDHVLRPIINDYLTRSIYEKVASFTHYGITTPGMVNLSDGCYPGLVFKLNDVEKVKSSSKMTSQNKETLKKATGLECRSVDVPKLIDHLWSVNINLKVKAVLMRNGDMAFINPLGGFYTVKFDENAPAIEYSTENIVATRNIRYTKVYPEIIIWLFKDVISSTPDQVFMDKLFIPLYKSVEYDTQYHTPLKEDGYNEMSDVMPLRLSKLLLKGTRSDTTIKSRSPIHTSVRLLTDLMQRNAADIVLNIRDPENANRMMKIENRFYKAWKTFHKHELCTMIYILYYLQGSIVSKQG